MNKNIHSLLLENSHPNRQAINTKVRDFPGGPVVKTLLFQCKGCGFDPWSGIQHAAWYSQKTKHKNMEVNIQQVLMSIRKKTSNRRRG